MRGKNGLPGVLLSLERPHMCFGQHILFCDVFGLRLSVNSSLLLYVLEGIAAVKRSVLLGLPEAIWTAASKWSTERRRSVRVVYTTDVCTRNASGQDACCFCEIFDVNVHEYDKRTGEDNSAERSYLLYRYSETAA